MLKKQLGKYAFCLVSIVSTLAMTFFVYRFQVPNPNVILMTVIVFFTFAGGFLCGIPTGIIVILYSLYFFSSPNRLFSYTVVNFQKIVAIAVSIPVMILLVGILKKRSDKKNEELVRLNAELRRLSMVDPLTQLPNRRSLEEVFYLEYHRAFRMQIPLSFAIVDIDFFKQYNDTYGHIDGDLCLKRVARAIGRTVCREGDFASRYGGEEFALILPNTDENGAAVLCRRIREAVDSLQIPHSGSSVSSFLTVSIGITSAIPKEQDNLLSFLQNADKALYCAKEYGRNRVEIHSEDPTGCTAEAP